MPFSAKLRKEIIKKLLTSPERKALYDKVKPIIDRALEAPGVRRAYITGSFASKKPNPSDIDLAVRLKNQEAVEGFIEDFGRFIPDTLHGKKRISRGVHIIPTEPKTRTSMGDLFDLSLTGLKPYREEGIKRYGKDYKWTRIASLLAALKAMGVVKKEEKEGD